MSKEKVVLIKTLVLMSIPSKINLPLIDLCDKCKRKIDEYNHRIDIVLNTVPICANYFFHETNGTVMQDGTYRTNSLSIRQHLAIADLTEKSKVGLSEGQYEQYCFLKH